MNKLAYDVLTYKSNNQSVRQTEFLKKMRLGFFLHNH